MKSNRKLLLSRINILLNYSLKYILIKYQCSLNLQIYLEMLKYTILNIFYNKINDSVQVPRTSKISIRTSIYFHPMSDGQVKIIQCKVTFP